MPKIHQLSLQEVQKIAAGEVIDRPANIVKELVENSLDAGATHIKICIEDGGKKLIRVIDNGCGMEPEDAKLCFAHHATSKITTLHDLEQCATFGFRGEALSSIASVSQIILVTKEEIAQFGTKLVLVDGVIIDESIVSANMGTDITIADLFYTIPARKKFLKTRDTEWRQILHLVQAYCLEYQRIHFELFSEGDSIINCPPTESLLSRVAQIWDYDMSNAMMPVSIADTSKQIAIEGLISHHHYAKYDRSSIFMFVNHRWIKNAHLCKAVLKGYANVLPPARYPVAALSITIDSSTVDINVHPRKEEVKFLHPQTVESLVTDCVKKALEESVSKKLAPKQPGPEYVYNPYRSFIPGVTVATAEAIPPIEFPQAPAFIDEPPIIQRTQSHTSAPAPQENLSIAHIEVQNDLQPTIIGQYKNTYIMIEHEDGLLLIDQHAAHERILYEQFATRFHEIATVKNLFPAMINITADDLALLEPHLGILHAHGIHVEPFGKNQLIVSSTPVHLTHIDMPDLVKQFISWLATDNQQTDIYEHLNDKLRALMACKAAVKAGDTLSMTEMKKIIIELRHTDNNLTCPHGRPTSWTLEHREIEKKFKRDYRSKPREL